MSELYNVGPRNRCVTCGLNASRCRCGLDMPAQSATAAAPDAVERAISRLLRKAPASRAMADDRDDWGSVLTDEERDRMRREAAEDEALAAHALACAAEINAMKAAGTKAYKACMRAWAAGEPVHLIGPMLDAVGDLGRAVGALGIDAPAITKPTP